MTDNIEFGAYDLESVVQQAMESLAADDITVVGADAHTSNQLSQVDMNEVDEEFQREIERQLEQSFQKQHDHSDHEYQISIADATHPSEGIKTDASQGNDNNGDDDDFAKEVERQLQNQFAQDKTLNQYQQDSLGRINDQTKSNSDGTTSSGEKIDVASADSHNDNNDNGSNNNNNINDHGNNNGNGDYDYTNELQKQIMAVFDGENGTDTNIFHEESNGSTLKEANHENKEADYETQLQELMKSFNEVEAQARSDDVTQTDNLHKQGKSENSSNGQYEPLAIDPVLDRGNTNASFNDALAELVQNVVNAKVDSATSFISDTAPGDDEEIDMNQIMQNALAMATEDPNTLIQSLNLAETSDVHLNISNQLIHQLSSSIVGDGAASDKKKVTKQAKEKKTPKEKKSRAPRKSAKKKKDQPIVSQIPTFQQSTPYPTVPFQFDPNVSNSHLLNLQSISKNTSNQQPIIVPPVLQQQVAQLQLQQQQRLQQQALLQQTQQFNSQSPDDASKSENKKQPKPAPANSIIDSVKKAPLVLLSKDTSIDLANSLKKKKASLSIAETLALSRSNMSSGKFFSQLQEQRNDLSNVDSSTSSLSTSVIPQQQITPQTDSNLQQKDVSQPLFKMPLQLHEPQDSSQQFSQTSALINSLSQPSSKINSNELETVRPLLPTSVELREFHSPSSSNPIDLESDTTVPTSSALKDPIDFEKTGLRDFEITSQTSKSSSSSSNILPIAPGSDSNSLLNSIGSVLHDLPSSLSDLITNAITNALSTNNQGNNKDLVTKTHKRKPVVDKNETPEQQKERIRNENRERKKRWRDANRLKNQNNDLRARLKKRASKLYGTEDTPKKLEWIDLEFEKRKNRRIIKSANLEDLSTVINETMNKLDVQTLNQNSLAKVVTQIISSALISNSTSNEDHPSVPKDSISQFKANETLLDDVEAQSKINDAELSNLISNSLNEQFPDLVISNSFDSSSTFNQSNNSPSTSHSSTQLQPKQLQSLQNLPDLSSEQPGMSQGLINASTSQANNSLALSHSAVAPKSSSQKRSSDVLSNFGFKKAKLSLIPLKPFNAVEIVTGETSSQTPTYMLLKGPDTLTSMEGKKSASEGNIKVLNEIKESFDNSEKPERKDELKTEASVSSKVKSKPTQVPIPSLNRPKLPSFYKPNTPSTSSVVSRAVKVQPSLSSKAISNFSTIESSNTVEVEAKGPLTRYATSSSSIRSSPLSANTTESHKDMQKTEAHGEVTNSVLTRPKFGPRKPSAFVGLRKPGAFQRPVDRNKKKIGV